LRARTDHIAGQMACNCEIKNEEWNIEYNKPSKEALHCTETVAINFDIYYSQS
jgi:hypothetical protein